MAGVKHAVVAWSGEGMKFQATAGAGYKFVMQAPADEHGATPMDYLLAGVAGCTAMDVISILQKKRQKVHGLEVEIKGVQAETPPNVYTEVEIVYIVTGEEIDPAAVERAIELSETKYCSASAMFQRSGTKMSASFRIQDTAVMAA